MYAQNILIYYHNVSIKKNANSVLKNRTYEICPNRQSIYNVIIMY